MPRLEIEGYAVEGISISRGTRPASSSFPQLAFDIGTARRPPSRRTSSSSRTRTRTTSGASRSTSPRWAAGGCARPPYSSPPASPTSCGASSRSTVPWTSPTSTISSCRSRLGRSTISARTSKVKTFRTYHRVPSQGYLIYKVKQKLKDEYAGFPAKENSLVSES
ncbi:hypothetical protein HU200_006425 [Digitaria exilis]|uniref:Uncharacterized protein n=1 Tax=Digitaria exilis TaxID=1010633 RepID=A0A835KTD9_9POAL|nr:hypothetical protein HU200_006425 [Digitaria exilis]